jgi:polyketide cyclase/dehydrase/lipid transport protein
MLKKIAIGVGLVIVAVLIIAANKPDSFRVQRVTVIHASADEVFPMIDDFSRWSTWSPWEKLDPAMQRTISVPPAGKGAVYSWKGNSEAGAGRMEIIESTPTSKLTIKLDFIEPFEGHNVTHFTLLPRGDSTEVTWAMDGPAPFVTKLMQVFIDMDKMIGKDFEAGLANMKRIAEKS